MNKRVKLVNYTPAPDKICDSAARLSQVDKSGFEIFNTVYEKNVIGNVLKLGHHSVAEHALFNFSFENVSVLIEHFMIEFRLGSYTVKSRRYVNFSTAGYILPDYLNEPAYQHLKSDFEKNVKTMFEAYNALVKLGIPAEDARFILPYCFKSNFFLSMNGRELLHALYSMINGKGSIYPEIKKTGEEMLVQLKTVSPDLFQSVDTIMRGSEDKWEKIADIFKNKNPQSGADVEILAYPPEATRDIINAVCSVFGVDMLTLTESETEALMDIIIQDRRARELEFANYSFIFRNISYPFLTHFIRHRIHSPLVPPFEYTGYDNVITPPLIQQNSDALEIFKNAVKKNNAFNKKLIEAKVPENGMVYSRVAGCTINVSTSMNARELLHFFSLRTCERAQWEIREYAIELLRQLKKISPQIFKKAGPNCYRFGKCTEGKMTCGKEKEKKEFFRNL